MESLVRRYEDGVLGLPKNGKFVAFSNSEAKSLACKRKFWFSQIEGLNYRGSKRMDAGGVWDALITDVYTWWQERDRTYPMGGLDRCVWCVGTGNHDGIEGGCPRCGGSGDSVLTRTMQPFRDAYERDVQTERGSAYTSEEIEKVEETLRRTLDGYLVRYQGGPLQTLKVVAVQPAIARGIVDPRTGKPFRGRVWLEEVPGRTALGLPAGVEYRIAGTGALGRPGAVLKPVSYPWYLIGRLDALLADRRTMAGVVLDAKNSTQPERYHNGMPFDPQLPGYCWLVEGQLEAFGLSSVSGFLYDVVNGKFQPDPKVLKWKPPSMAEMKEQAEARSISIKGMKKASEIMDALGIVEGPGELSRDTGAGVSSWRYIRAVKAAGASMAEYEDHIQLCAETVDRKLYRRDPMTFSEERRVRFGREIFAKARLIQALRKTAAGITDASELDIHFDRTDVCTGPGGGCPYSGPCALDAVETRAGYDVVPSQRWGENLAAPTPDEQAEDHDDNDASFDW